MYYDERNIPMTAQTASRGGFTNFLVGLVALVLLIGLSLTIASMLGYSTSVTDTRSAPIPPPTPIIRVVGPALSQPQPAVEQPVRPAVVAPAVQQPVVAPAPAEQPTAPPTRQIIIIKQADNPAAAPIVIDRGTKRRSP